MTVSAVIPTLNAGESISALVSRLLEQTVRPEILIVDSSSDDGIRARLAPFGDRLRLITIPRESFDHGGTRDMALRQCSGDIVLFLTQDALPLDDTYIEQLVSAFEDGSVAAAYARQIAFEDAPEYEKLIRQFNYPDQSRKWTEADIERYGVKAYFFSNVCSAYRRSAYEDIGGFDRPIISNEDMVMAAKLLHRGWSLAYCAEARLSHSHRLTVAQDYERNAMISQVMEQYRDRLYGANIDSEGLKLVKYVSGRLISQGRIGQCAVFAAHAAAKYLGNRVGKRRFRRTEKAK